VPSPVPRATFSTFFSAASWSSLSEPVWMPTRQDEPHGRFDHAVAFAWE
jgi:hypothetical protein